MSNEIAWGINLPAHTVVIKGTEIYNPEKGGNVDLSILDVQQIFGRAGRPQFDTFGEAALLTLHDSLSRYINLLVSNVPIESNFIKQLPEHLNAEVVAGTASNIREAVEWLKYTYLYVRMLRNPLIYGISHDQKEDDPLLTGRCQELVKTAAKRLDELHMLRFDDKSGNLARTELGATASHFYIRTDSVATFNEKLEHMTSPDDGDLCHLVCCASEFDNIKVRQEEMDEIDTLNKACFLKVNIPTDEFSGKCCVLLQNFISNAKISSFTLISDTNYIAVSQKFLVHLTYYLASSTVLIIFFRSFFLNL
jgi:activating signal cointegrator complex subunit 3